MAGWMKMALGMDGRHLGKIEKSPYLSDGSTDFDRIWYDDAVQPS